MFENTFKLNKDEHVIRYVRRHWIFLAFEVLQGFLLFIIPAILIWIIQFYGFMNDFPIFGLSFNSFTNILIYMWGIFCWLFIAEKFTDNSLDFWIITNKRIVESELIGLFNRKLSTLELQDIEDITIQNKGFFSNIIKFGRLEVQTAGAITEFFADNIADPEQVQQIMFDAKLKDEEEKKYVELAGYEKLTHRIINEDVGAEFLQKDEQHIPSDQRQNQKIIKQDIPANYDWANISEKQKNDIRNLQEEIEKIEDKYKKNISSALRSE